MITYQAVLPREREAWINGITVVQERCQSFIHTLPSSLQETTLAFLDRLNPDKAWVEWYFPLFLGKIFEIEEEATYAVAVANVLGMIYIRSLNDLSDGAHEPIHHVRSLVLGPLLYTHCLNQFCALFPPTSPFWKYLVGYMQQWAHAIALERERHWFRALDYDLEELLCVAIGKGAPEKICCAALALLGGQGSLIPVLEKAMDLRSAVAQLVDDFQDWKEDLTNHRYNVFLTAVMSEEQRHDPSLFSLEAACEAFYRSSQILALFDCLADYARQVENEVAEVGFPLLSEMCEKSVHLCVAYPQLYKEQRDQYLLNKLQKLVA